MTHCEWVTDTYAQCTARPKRSKDILRLCDKHSGAFERSLPSIKMIQILRFKKVKDNDHSIMWKINKR